MFSLGCSPAKVPSSRGATNTSHTRKSAKLPKYVLIVYPCETVCVRSYGSSFILPSSLPSFLCARPFAQTEFPPYPTPVKSLLFSSSLNGFPTVISSPSLSSSLPEFTSPPTSAFQPSSLCPATPSTIHKSVPSFLLSAHLIRLDCI